MSPAALSVLRNVAPDCNGNGIDDPTETAAGLSADCDGNSVPDECDPDCNASGIPDACDIASDPSLDLDVDGIPDACELAGTPYCFGDGTGAPCPCDPGQAGAAGSGCGNSVGLSGRLAATGNAQVNLDSVTLRAATIPPTTVALFFQGSQQQAGGLGSPFGDGLLCVNQSVVRLATRAASQGVVQFGHAVPGDPSVSVAGHVPAATTTRYYQVWYRDAAAFCTTLTFNLTNGVVIGWQP